MDLSNYVRVATYDLPEPTRTSAPTGNLLAQEASGVTYNWDTNTLFIVGDGGTSVTQVSLTGQLIDTMTLPQGSSPQGTEFYDTEGITYVGGGKFVFTEERLRQVVEFTYAAGTTLTRADTKTVDLGTDIGNVGLEGITYDPQTGGFVLVKEKDPLGVFQTTIDFNAGTASNGSSTTVASTNLFDPAAVGTTDLSDVYALSSNAAFVGTTQEGHLLILSQESGKIVEIGRDGTVYNSLQLVAPTTSTGIGLAAMTVEGITMGPDGTIYLVSEEGGGDFNHPQLWVYAPASTGANLAPTGVTLSNPTTSILENSSTAAHIKVADIAVADDGQGANTLSLTGTDAAAFEIEGTSLYLKAGVTLDYETKKNYAVTVNVDDTTVGSTPDASTNYTLNVGNVVNEGAEGSVVITEVAPWSSSSPVGSDWFELTNTGSTAISLAGWKMDDNSYAFASAVALSGVPTLAAGESAIFLEVGSNQTAAGVISAFTATWFGGTVPAGLHIGTYSGSGVGLSTSGDAVAVFDSTGTLKASVSFGASPAGPALSTFDNGAQLNSTSLTSHVTISTLSAVGTNGAFAAAGDANEAGSPGAAGGVPAPVNQAPTAIGLTGEITSLSDDTSTAAHVKLASIIVNDDGLGTNVLSLTGADAAFFEVDATGLYLKAGVVLDAASKSHYDVVVNVDDVTVGSTPDASVSFALDLTHVATSVRITEVAPWSSGNSPVGSDWFEVTNTGSSSVNLTGWKMDDSSFSFASAVALSGVPTLAAGESAIFLEVGSSQTAAGVISAFTATWFGGTVPAGLHIGTYSGSGIGLSTGGDGVALYNASGALQAKVSFGSSSSSAPFATFDNAAGLDNVTLNTLSVIGTHGAFAATNDANEIGSPGTIVTPNHAPVALDDIGTALVEDSVQGAAGFVLANDSDADNDALRVAGVRAGTEAAGGSFSAVTGTAVVQGLYGSLTIHADGSYSYALDNGSAAIQALNTGQHVSDIFSYQVADTHDATDVAQLSFDIAGVNDGPPITSGTNAVDTINGSNLADQLNGLAGDDRLFGNDGDDILNGGLGRDTLNGGEGIDTATYGDATSSVVADLGAKKGSFGEALGDKYVSIENLTGSSFDDALFGDRFDNVLSGGAGDDVLEGLGGADTLIGGAGNDILNGGDGIDRMTGGAGIDIFTFLKGDSGKTADTADTIVDFLSGTDKIDLSAIDANAKTKTTFESFTFIGNSAFHKVAGELHYEVSGSDLYVSADFNGDAKADFMIHLTGVSSLTIDDFIL